MEVYKNWEIVKSDYACGWYEATSLTDCDAYMKFSTNLQQIKDEIDEEQEEV